MGRKFSTQITVAATMDCYALNAHGAIESVLQQQPALRCRPILFPSSKPLVKAGIFIHRITRTDSMNYFHQLIQTTTDTKIPFQLGIESIGYQNPKQKVISARIKAIYSKPADVPALSILLEDHFCTEFNYFVSNEAQYEQYDSQQRENMVRNQVSFPFQLRVNYIWNIIDLDVQIHDINGIPTTIRQLLSAQMTPDDTPLFTHISGPLDNTIEVYSPATYGQLTWSWICKPPQFFRDYIQHQDLSLAVVYTSPPPSSPAKSSQSSSSTSTKASPKVPPTVKPPHVDKISDNNAPAITAIMSRLTQLESTQQQLTEEQTSLRKSNNETMTKINSISDSLSATINQHIDKHHSQAQITDIAAKQQEAQISYRNLKTSFRQLEKNTQNVNAALKDQQRSIRINVQEAVRAEMLPAQEEITSKLLVHIDQHLLHSDDNLQKFRLEFVKELTHVNSNMGLMDNKIDHLTDTMDNYFTYVKNRDHKKRKAHSSLESTTHQSSSSSSSTSTAPSEDDQPPMNPPKSISTPNPVPNTYSPHRTRRSKCLSYMSCTPMPQPTSPVSLGTLGPLPRTPRRTPRRIRSTQPKAVPNAPRFQTQVQTTKSPIPDDAEIIEIQDLEENVVQQTKTVKPPPTEHGVEPK